jgi:hypothetical protein
MAERKLILKYLKKNYPDGGQIGTFDGGDDSGGCEVNTSEYSIEIEEMCEYELGYGSWAGCFHAFGTIEFDPKDGVINIYGDEEDRDFLIPVKSENFEVSVPKGYESVTVHVDSWYNREHVNVRGFIEHGRGDVEGFKKMKENIEEGIVEFLEGSDEYDTCYLDENFTEKSSFTLSTERYKKRDISLTINLNGDD